MLDVAQDSTKYRLSYPLIFEERGNYLILIVFLLAVITGYGISTIPSEDTSFSDLSNSLKERFWSDKSNLGVLDDLYASIYSRLTGARDYSENPHGMDGLYAEPEGSLDSILKKNTKTWTSTKGAPSTIVRTNRYGLRDDNFTVEPSDNNTRIMVVGDSYVYGWGVNKSERFTEKLERRLNEEKDGSYEVINAAVPGWGAEDYYNFIEQRGMDYKPDVIVVGLVGNDWYSAEQQEKWMAEAKNYVDTEYSDISDVERRELLLERYQKIIQDNYSSEGLSPLKSISRLAQSHEVPVIYYVLDRNLDANIKWLEAWAEESDENVIYAPDTIRDDRKSEFCLKYSRNRLSTTDPHPSPEGHRLLAERLLRELNDQEDNVVPWKSVGFFQWIDPC